MAKITDATYQRPPRRTRPSRAVQRLSERLHVEPRTVRQLARDLDVSLYWLDVATGPDVIAGQPASWDACLVLGLDPRTGEPLRRAS